MYEYADKVLKDINRRNLHAFDRIKIYDQMKFDELNILKRVTEVFEESIRLCRKKYRMIADDAFIEALILLGYLRDEAEELAEKKITDKWVSEILEAYDPVALYKFTTEAERKKQKLIEALIASHNKGEEVDKALKAWTIQIGHFADVCVDEATVDAFIEAGVEYVRWVAVDDNRTCRECEERDGEIYPIEEIPPKPHIRCRCEITPA